jgi:hypothetical protein
MIAFGIAVACERTYARFAMPGLRRVWEPDSLLFERRGARCLFMAYNEMLVRAAAIDGLEALVLLHEDTEILDDRFADKIRSCLAQAPDAAVVGVMGGVGVTSLAWWEAPVAKGRVLAPAIPPGLVLDCGDPGRHDVDAVDGLLMALSPWAVRELRFDETLCPGFHGYDVDFCTQARARGKRVVVDGIEVAHHASRGMSNRAGWIAAHVAFARKWEGRLPASIATAGVQGCANS